LVPGVGIAAAVVLWYGLVGLGEMGSKSKKVRSLGEMEKVRRVGQSGVGGGGLEFTSEVGSGCWSLAVVVVAGAGVGCCCVWLFLKERNLERKETMVAVLALSAMRCWEWR
jgi:hypothetical protein